MTTTAPTRSSNELSHRQIMTIIVGLMAGMFLAALDQNIVGTAIKTIADELHGLDQQAWVTTAYLITSTISTPIYGRLSDMYGRKPFFLAAISIFIGGSMLCTLADSMYSLAAYRAIQGLGAGGLFSLALAIVGDIVPPRERPRYQGYFLAVFATSSVLGPVIGGFFAEQPTVLGLTGWRWVFLVNVPVGILALVLVSMTLHLKSVPHKARVDWWGALFLVVGVVPLLLVAEQGNTWGWASTNSILCFAIGLVGLAAFIYAEYRMGDDALIPLRIFRNRTIAIALVSGVVIGAGMFGGMVVLPQFLQIVHGATPTSSGFMMLPMILGNMIAAVVSGQLMTRLGKIRIFPLIGTALMTLSLVGFVFVGADTPLWIVMVLMFFFGLGLGNTMQPLTLVVQAAVNPREIGMATSAATFFRQMGGTLGVAVFLSVLFNTLGENIKQAFTAAAKTPEFIAALKDPAVLADPVNRAFVKGLTSGDPSAMTSVLSDSSTIAKLNPILAHPFKVGFSTSMDLVFLLGAIVCAIGVVVLCFLPETKLSGASAQAKLADSADEAEAEAERIEGKVPEHTVTDDLVDVTSRLAAGHTIKELPDYEPRRAGSDKHQS
ncbi:MAG: MDR family MFS transporter [Propionibacteriaceae bacterium]